MDKIHPLSTPMVIRSFDVSKDPFQPLEDNQEPLDPKVPYLSAIRTLMYLANNIRLNISFFVNLLTRYNSSPMWRYWDGIKYFLRYLQGTIDFENCLIQINSIQN